MSINKLTGQQEIFCREYVRCGIATQAYRAAYNVRETTKPESVWPAASRIMAQDKVRARIRAMQEELAEVTVGELVAGLRQSRDMALEDRNASAATGAVATLGRLKGYFKDDPGKAGDIHIHFAAELKGVL